MGKHILFLVHGMGSYGKYENGKWVQDTEGWFKEAEKTVRDVYDIVAKNAPDLSFESFEKGFAIERVEYDSFLEGYRHDWEYQAKTWDAFGFDGGIAGALTEFFQGNNDKAFLWTHVADVLLYMSHLMSDAIHAHVSAQVIAGLRKHHQGLDLGAWSIVAHSLGTAVSSNSLRLIMQAIAQDPDLREAALPPTVLCMAANVTRALSSPADAYSDILKPTDGFGVTNYLSCSHTLDPFCRIRPFSPSDPSWVNAPGYVALNDLSGYYLANEFIDWIQGWDDFDKFAAVVPHGFSHYMRQPRVAAQLWPRLQGREPSNFPQLESVVRNENETIVRKAVTDAVRKKLEQEVRKRLEGALDDVSLPTDKADVAKQLIEVLSKLKGF